MPDDDAAVRLFVLEHCVREAGPPTVEQMMIEFDRPRPEIESALERLEAGRHLKLVPGTHRILMAFPFSALATPFKVTLANGRRYFANCAWDALALYVMLRQAVTIESYCHHCASPIAFGLADGRADFGARGPPVVYLGLPARTWWDDIIHSCSNTMLFFADSDHLTTWRESRPLERGETVSVETVLGLSGPIYATKLSPDYARPDRERTRALFRQLGLTGEFWEI
ncbi:MAG TPA: organomercurial lyase [Thermoplasmata archaeon]|nr:organomercurial lyase [Thermoplasmata archaeon]